VRLGITDGSMTEVIIPAGSPEEAVLREGAAVIIGVTGGAAATPGASGAGGSSRSGGPRMMF
jgi:HlyD family secretion protein